MAIEISELNEWINTDDGKKWGDEFKSALLKNRDDLLSEIKVSGAKLSELEQRFSQTENELSAEKAALSKFLIDDELNRLLSNTTVFTDYIPMVCKTLKETYGFNVVANGDSRKAVGKYKDKDGNETEADMQAIVFDVWSKTEGAKQFMRNNNTGGGAPGSSNVSTRRLPVLNNMDGRQLAGMSDAEFTAARQQQLAKKT
ncbi:MAG: hypothetical protein FWG27_03610 [Treponema sp.]|nr:hypothetical protein [Treponema sp.]